MDQLDLSRDVRARLSELSRRNGETEDRLLRRLLGLAGENPGGVSASPETAGSGFEDATYAILFPRFEWFHSQPIVSRFCAHAMQHEVEEVGFLSA